MAKAKAGAKNKRAQKKPKKMQQDAPTRITATAIKAELAALASPQKKKASEWFFKTGKGMYGAHEQFIGVTVPEQRKIAKRYQTAPSSVVLALLKSKIHEHRLTALIIWTLQYKKATKKERRVIYTAYLANTKHINNWDLVDVSAPILVGEYLRDHARWERVLRKLARSESLWEKRIAIVATLAFSRTGNPEPCLDIAQQLLRDDHDLIHKATGWMLREMGKGCGTDLLEQFLKIHYKKMPRTMLRYSIERLPEKRRKQYLKGDIE